MLLNTSYIKYWIKSTNQHGVHSPFVYGLITKGLYQKQSKGNHPLLDSWKKSNAFDSRKEKIINRSLIYLNNEGYLNEHENTFKSNKTRYFSLKNETLQTILEKKNDSTFFIVDAINISEGKKEWEKLKLSNKFTISIEFYNIGFLFIKDGQAKENFCIRI